MNRQIALPWGKKSLLHGGRTNDLLPHVARTSLKCSYQDHYTLNFLQAFNCNNIHLMREM